STRPPARRWTPTSERSSVDLPPPLGPTRPVTAPAGTSSESPSSTATPPRSTRRPSTTTAGGRRGSDEVIAARRGRAPRAARRRRDAPARAASQAEPRVDAARRARVVEEPLGEVVEDPPLGPAVHPDLALVPQLHHDRAFALRLDPLHVGVRDRAGMAALELE